jgi:hypothetical protein
MRKYAVLMAYQIYFLFLFIRKYLMRMYFLKDVTSHFLYEETIANMD